MQLSVIVPVYNMAAEGKLNYCMDSLVNQTIDDYEIIAVDDASTDNSLEVLRSYEEKYSGKVRVLTYPDNRRQGGAKNEGLRAATGDWIGFIDSDDWVNEEALLLILSFLKELERDDKEIDMLVSNYVYEKVGAAHKKCIHYRNVLPQDKIFTWDEIGRFHLDQYILMHSVIYRTSMIKLSQMTLPKHTFYVDNIYVYYPLPHVRKIYYMDVDFYRYFIGREDQSVNEKVMISRVDQQIFVTKTMIDMYHLRDISSRKLRHYMVNYLAIMMTVSSILLIRSKKQENLEKKRELWRYLKKKDLKIYLRIRYGILGQTMNIPGRPGRRISSLAYSVARRIIGFN